MSVARMRAPQRQDLIMTAIRQTGFVTIPEMAESCRVSEMTLRRDLDQLAGRKLVTRIHGGAVVPDDSDGPRVDLVEPSVDTRAGRSHEAKQMIARRAHGMVVPGQTIALDIGTTTFELARLLRDVRLRVFTNSLKIAGLLSESRPSVYIPGGQVSGSEPSIIGARAIEYLNSFFFDIVFIGVSGLSAEGYFDYSLEDTEIKKTLISRARQKVVLLDSTKFDRMSVALVARMNEIDSLITDAPPPQKLSQALEAAGVRVELAQSPAFSPKRNGT